MRDWLFEQWNNSSGSMKDAYYDLIVLLGYQWSKLDSEKNLLETLRKYYDKIGFLKGYGICLK